MNVNYLPDCMRQALAPWAPPNAVVQQSINHFLARQYGKANNCMVTSIGEGDAEVSCYYRVNDDGEIDDGLVVEFDGVDIFKTLDVRTIKIIEIKCLEHCEKQKIRNGLYGPRSFSGICYEESFA